MFQNILLSHPLCEDCTMGMTIAALAALTLYLLATGLLFKRFWGQQNNIRPTLLGVAAAAVCAHAILFWLAASNSGELSVGFYHALSMVAVLVVFLTLAASALRPFENLGIVLFPTAMVTVLLQWLVGAESSPTADLEWQIQLHAALSVFAFAVLSIAAAQALMLALQEHAVKANQFEGPSAVLPALRTMESMLFQLIAVGFGLLTLALLTGVLFVENLLAQHLVHKTILSGLSWMVFGVLLWGRWRHGWRGRTAIRMTLSGMAVLLLAYFGSKLVLEILLGKA
jgi:ABC-type uncharacterized transport system permease subunit